MGSRKPDLGECEDVVSPRRTRHRSRLGKAVDRELVESHGIIDLRLLIDRGPAHGVRHDDVAVSGIRQGGGEALVGRGRVQQGLQQP